MSGDRSTPSPRSIREAEQFQHPPGAGAEIEQRAHRLVAERVDDRRLDRLVGGVQFADAIPLRGMGREIILRRLRARLAHGGQSFAVARQDRIVGIEIIGQKPHHLRAALLVGDAEEGPGALAMAFDQSGFGQQLEMTRNARLRLAQDFGQVGDGEFGLGQEREDAQTRGLRGRAQSGVDEFEWQPADHCRSVPVAAPLPENI